MAAAVFENHRDRVEEFLEGCVSGRELIECGFAADVTIAARLDSRSVVPERSMGDPAMRFVALRAGAARGSAPDPQLERCHRQLPATSAGRPLATAASSTCSPTMAPRNSCSSPTENSWPTTSQVNRLRPEP